MLKKRGLSAVIATLLMILLTLVAVGIIWAVINNILKGGAEQVELGQYTLDLEIKAVQIQNGDVTVVVVKRNPGQGEFVGMNFVFSDGQNSETIREDVSLVEGDTKSFTLTLTKISTSELKSVSVYPIYKLSSGKESIGNIADTFDVKTGASAATGGNFAALGYSGMGMKEYIIPSRTDEIVKFSKAIVDPLDVLPGDNQTFTVHVSSPNGISSVTSVTELDNSVLNLDFEHISGNSGSVEIWSASWIVNDTHTIEYRTKITATDSQGNSNSVTLTWTDSCQSQITHDATTNNLTTSCTTGVNSVGGKDGGSIALGSGVTLTLDSGSNFIFNQGKSINVTASGARIVATGGGSFGNGYLFYTDADGDSRAPDSTLSFSTTSSSLSGKVRAQSALSTSDCNETNSSIWTTGYGRDGDGDNYGISSFGCNNGASPFTATAGTDCYDSNSSANPGQTSYFTANRGDGSFDYNCNSGVETNQIISICEPGVSPCTEFQYLTGYWVGSDSVLDTADCATTQYVSTVKCVSACPTDIPPNQLGENSLLPCR